MVKNNILNEKTWFIGSHEKQHFKIYIYFLSLTFFTF